jgi:soluble lytic murein transglycosylase-like protein
MWPFLALMLVAALAFPAPAVTIDLSLDVAPGFAVSPDVAPPPRIGRLHLPPQYWAWMQEAGRDYNVDPCLIAATAAIESRLDPGATSGRGRCVGLMQLHKDTARSLGVNPWDPRENIRGGAQVLARLLRRYNGDLRRVYRKYNASCTSAYYREVMKAYRQAKRAGP